MKRKDLDAIKAVYKLLGQRGGLARAKKLTKAQRLEISQHANKAKAKKAKKGRAIMKTLGIALLGLLFLSGCGSGGGDDSVSTVTAREPVAPPPVAQATLFWIASSYGPKDALLRGGTDGRAPVTLTERLQGDGVFNDEAGVYYNTNETWWVAGFDGTAPRNIGPAHPFIPTVEPGLLHQAQVAGRAVFLRENRDIFSIRRDGTDRRHIAALPPGGPIINWVRAGAGDHVMFGVEEGVDAGIKSVSVLGGEVLTLADGPTYDSFGVVEVVSQRIVYHACAVAVVVGACDVYSVRNDGTGTIALSTHPDNDAIQGVIGTRVLVRRSRSGPTDTLVSLAVDGTGSETAITTLSYHDDFVAGVVGDRIILKRGLTLTSMLADGTGEVTLTQDERGYPVSAGSFLILYRLSSPGPQEHGDLWSVPIDGSRPAQPFATTDANEWFVIGR